MHWKKRRLAVFRYVYACSEKSVHFFCLYVERVWMVCWYKWLSKTPRSVQTSKIVCTWHRMACGILFIRKLLLQIQSPTPPNFCTERERERERGRERERESKHVLSKRHIWLTPMTRVLKVAGTDGSCRRKTWGWQSPRPPLDLSCLKRPGTCVPFKSTRVIQTSNSTAFCAASLLCRYVKSEKNRFYEGPFFTIGKGSPVMYII